MMYGTFRISVALFMIGYGFDNKFSCIVAGALMLVNGFVMMNMEYKYQKGMEDEKK